MSHSLVGPAVMRRSSNGRMRIPHVAFQGQRTYVTPSITPSHVPDTPADFDSGQFGVLGKWSGTTIRVPLDGQTEALARFLSLRSGNALDESWAAAEAAMPRKFKSYRLLRLFNRTLVLPAGEVVFEVEEVPTGKLPDDPPDRVYALCARAMMTVPGANFSLLTPMFDVPPIIDEPVRLVTSRQLAIMQLGARIAAENQARRWGWWYRAERWIADRQEAREKARAAEAAVKAKRIADEFARRMETEARRTPGLLEDDSVLSPRLLAVQQRIRATLRGNRSAADELMLEVLRFRRFDPIVIYESPDALDQVRMVVHWMRIRDRAGNVRMLVHE